jgi:Spy/CpxP family protein refolding chaperone
MLRRHPDSAAKVRKLLQNLPPTGAKMRLPSDSLAAAVSDAQLIRIVAFLLAVAVASTATAQSSRPPTAGPGPEPVRRTLWQLLTPEQRDQLWRTLSTEQRADVWRSLEPQERREFRDRLGFAEGPGVGPGPGRGPRTMRDGVDDHPRQMTPEERQKMRDQIREAHRQRRERTEADRRGPTQ